MASVSQVSNTSDTFDSKENWIQTVHPDVKVLQGKSSKSDFCYICEKWCSAEALARERLSNVFFSMLITDENVQDWIRENPCEICDCDTECSGCNRVLKKCDTWSIQISIKGEYVSGMFNHFNKNVCPQCWENPVSVFSESKQKDQKLESWILHPFENEDFPKGEISFDVKPYSFAQTEEMKADVMPFIMVRTNKEKFKRCRVMALGGKTRAGNHQEFMVRIEAIKEKDIREWLEAYCESKFEELSE